MPPSCLRAELEQTGKSVCTDWCSAYYFLRASASIWITQGLKWFQNKRKMPSYLNARRHSLYDAKCHSGSCSENSGSQAARGSLHPVDKMRQKTKNKKTVTLDETDDTAGLRLANPKCGCHFLVTSCVPGTVLSTLHRFSHLILVINCMKASPQMLLSWQLWKIRLRGFK